MTTTARTLVGEGLRWYLKRARHPGKNYVVGHYWPWFCRRRVWVRYDRDAAIRLSIGDYLQQRIFLDGSYELALLAWLRSTLRPTDVFWDVGANIGAVSLVAAPRCGHVVAFEPDPRSLEALRENLRMNRLDNVRVVPAGLGQVTGAGELYQGPSGNSGMSSIVQDRLRQATAVRIDLLAADAFVRDHPELTPDVIKLDVEGAEHLVLAGATGLLRSQRVRAIAFEDAETSDGRPGNEALVARLAEAKYAVAPLGRSDAIADDGLMNFIAVPSAVVQ